MRLYTMLKLKPGVTAVIGSGGKTKLLHALAGELRGRVILCTTTRMHPSEKYPTFFSPKKEDIKTALKTQRVICIGEPAENGKLKSSALPMTVLSELADYVLVEADGAKRLPLKAHDAHEPVIPENANQTICVIGAAGIGRPILEAAHRPERFAEHAGAGIDQKITPDMTARVIAAEGLADRLFINQTETKKSLLLAKRLAKGLKIPVVAGSLNNGTYKKLR